MRAFSLINVAKRYKGDVVLDEVSFDAAPGETIVLFGPSGAGKTVLLRLLAGVIEPDSGQVRIAGRDMAEVEPEDRGIGMAFQNFALFPHMSAFDNIASPLAARRRSRARIKAGVDSVARLLKIDQVLDHMPRALSNGQKQRTALARALVGDPALLLLDDPLRNVDAKLRFEMRLELPRLLADRGATVVYVTQDYKEAMALGDRIVVMEAGAIRQIGTPADIYLAPGSIDIARLFGDPAINLFDVTPKADAQGLFATLSGTPVRLDQTPGAAQAGGGALGGDCVLGLRPEAIRFAPPDAPGAAPVTIEAETPLNEKTVTLALTAGGREILISRPAGAPGPKTGVAHIVFDAGAAMLFSRDSGLRIGAGAGGAARNGEAA